MTCSDFEAHWKLFVSGALDGATGQSMAVHARSCRECGKRSGAHEELSTSLQAVLEAKQFPADLADNVAEQAYLDHFGTSLRLPNTSPALRQFSNVALGPLLLAALIGGIAGYLAARTNNSPGLMEQLRYAEMLGRRGSPAMGGFGFGLLDIAKTVRVLFFMFLLLLITRTRAWEILFPVKFPGGLLVARWIATPVALVGAAHIVLSVLLWVSTPVGGIAAGARMGRGFTGGYTDEASIWMFRGLLDQLWSLGFWFTMFVVLFTLLNQGLLWYARGLQQQGQARQAGNRLP